MCHLIAPADYIALSQTVTLDNSTADVHLMINITDDMLDEPEERFEIMMTSLNGSCVVTPSSPIPVFIIENDGTDMFTYTLSKWPGINKVCV